MPLNHYNFTLLTLKSIFIYNISYNIIFKTLYLIFINFFKINYSPFLKSFISTISIEFNNADNLKYVSPVENISLFSGSNYPNPD